MKKTLDRNTSPKCRRPFGWQKAGNEKAQNTALHTEAFLRAHFDGLASAFAFREGGDKRKGERNRVRFTRVRLTFVLNAKLMPSCLNVKSPS